MKDEPLQWMQLKSKGLHKSTMNYYVPKIVQLHHLSWLLKGTGVGCQETERNIRKLHAWLRFIEIYQQEVNREDKLTNQGANREESLANKVDYPLAARKTMNFLRTVSVNSVAHRFTWVYVDNRIAWDFQQGVFRPRVFVCIPMNPDFYLVSLAL